MVDTPNAGSPAHSSLGASGMERWEKCPGSVALLQSLELGESDEPDYRTDGVTAHAGAAWCLEHGADAWEQVGCGFDGNPFTEAMVEPVQLYLDECRAYITKTSEHFIEYRISRPSIHAKFFGTVDFGSIDGEWLTVVDYKNGAGIVVEVSSPQFKYYAYGLLLDPNAHDVKWVRITVVQPNAFHVDGPVRHLIISADELRAWAADVLVPAMLRTEIDNDLDPGSHCRFCPAKLVCPAMVSLFGAAATANPDHVVHLDDSSLGRSYQQLQAVQFYKRALEAEVFRRLNQGHEIEGCKLVRQKTDRVFKEGAEARFKAEFGKDAYVPGSFKTPAQMEKIGAHAKELVREWAYTPQRGLTVALADDNRVAVRVQSSQEAFSGYLGKEEEW